MRAYAAPARRACRAAIEFLHFGYGRSAPGAETADGGRTDRHQALGAARTDVDHSALERPRPDPRSDWRRRRHRFSERPRQGPVRGLPEPPENTKRRRFRRSAAAYDGDPAVSAGGAGAVPSHVPLYSRGRVSGHQRRPIPLAAAAGAEPQEHLLRRRRRSVDLFLARRRGRKYFTIRKGFRRRENRAPGIELPFHRLDPRGGIRPDRA